MEALFGADYERITDDNAVDLEADVEDLTATWKACAPSGKSASELRVRRERWEIRDQMRDSESD